MLMASSSTQLNDLEMGTAKLARSASAASSPDFFSPTVLSARPSFLSKVIDSVWRRRTSSQRKLIAAFVVVTVILVLYVYFAGGPLSNATSGLSFGRFGSSLTAYGTTPKHLLAKYGADASEYRLVMVADRDTFSFDAKEQYWRSLLVRGTLKRFIDDSGNVKYTYIHDSSNQQELKGLLVEKKRGLELSELKWYGDRLYTVDDRTGIVYEVKLDPKQSKLIQRFILSDGNGETSAKGFKGEWMTVKDGSLLVGSIGKEWTDGKTGAIINEDPMWIKQISLSGSSDGSTSGCIVHKSFVEAYNKLREKILGSDFRTKGGYMVHEAIEWNDYQRRWYILPRRVSKELYDEDADVYRGANIIVSADEHFRDIRVINIEQSTVNTRGFSSFKFVPGRSDEIVAIKSEEKGEKMQSYITVIRTDGKVLMPETQFIEEKIEGLEFA